MFVPYNEREFVFMLTEKAEEKSISEEHGHKSDEHLHSIAHEEYFVFERLEVKNGMSQGGVASLSFYHPVEENAEYVIRNARALFSEMKKDNSGHGHAH